MGYCASGEGYITFAGMVTADALKEISAVAKDVFDTDYSEGTLVLYVECGGKWYGDAVTDILRRIAGIHPVADGEVDFCGEDGSLWRFLWTGSEWEEQNGKVVYEPAGTDGCGAALIQKPLDEGLDSNEAVWLCGKLSGPVIPVEIQGEHSTAMGFISLKAAESVNYEYSDGTEFSAFIKGILDDVDSEPGNGCCVFTNSMGTEVPVFIGYPQTT